MKKLLTITFTSLFFLTLTACGKNDTHTSSNKTISDSAKVSAKKHSIKSASQKAASKSASESTKTSNLEASSSIASASQSIANAKSNSIAASQSESIVAESTSQTNNIDVATEQLIGKKYSIIPKLYDGIDSTQAMEENKAPQNLVHDGASMITFKNNTTVYVELAGTYRPNHDEPYTITNDTITINNNSARVIPYSLSNGTITLNSWTSNMDGHTVTWAITPSN